MINTLIVPDIYNFTCTHLCWYVCIESWVNWWFCTVVLEKTLESPLEFRESQPVHSKGMMLKLKLQYFGHLMRRVDSLEKSWFWDRLKAEGEGWDGWMASPTRWAWVWASFGSWWRTGKLGVFLSTGSLRVKHDWATEPNRVSTEFYAILSHV